MDELRFKLDEEWYDLPEHMETFGTLREWVNLKLKDEGRVLLGILNGDVSIRVEEMEIWGERRIGDFDTLEFLSAEPVALACRTCEDLIDFMDVLEERGEQMKAAILSGDSEKLAFEFKECVEGWNIALQGFRNLLQVGEIDSAVIEIGGRSLPTVATELRGLVLKMASDYADGDLNSLYSTLANDMVRYIAPMQEAFVHVHEKLEKIAV